MIVRAIFLAACVVGLAACSEPTRTTDDTEGSYGASSGPNANDSDAQVAAQDKNPTYDEPETGTGSEFGGPARPESADSQARPSTPPTAP